MRPSTPHYTSPADLREKLNRRFEQPNQPRIQTGIRQWNGGAFRGLAYCLMFEAAAVLVAIVIWRFMR